MKFCPRCDNIMLPDKDRKHWVCRKCGYKERIDQERDKEHARIREEIKHRPDELPFVVEDVRTLPTTRVECPKCGNSTAYYWEAQTRTGDEPGTIFFKCTKCGYVWRSYD